MAKSVKNFAKKLLAISLENKRVNGERVNAILETLKSNPPRHYKEILQEYLLKVRGELRKENAKIEHAGDLSESEVKSIKENLSNYYNRDIEVHLVNVPELLAGVRVSIADDVWDASALNRLRQLTQFFK